MTLYNRPRAEVFADNAPPSEIQPFHAWLRGLGIAFDETNGLPEMTGLNGLFNALNQYIKYLEQNGFAEWSADLEYPVGAGVRVGSVWYRAKTRNTNKPPATSQNDWALFLNANDLSVSDPIVLSNNRISVRDATTTQKGVVRMATSTEVANRSNVTAFVKPSDIPQPSMVPDATTSTKGIVQLNNTLTSTNTTQALTAAQGKTLQDGKLGRSENAVSATNCSRSIVAGNGLSGGGDLTANRTLTLGTPGTVTASTGNTVSASSHTHNLDVNSLPLLGVGQTWQNVTSSRSGGVTYTNNTGRPIQVLINANLNNGSLVIGGVTIPINDSDFYAQPSFIVPSGSSYRVNVGAGGSILTWAELR